MKKFIMLILSITLISSSFSPFVVNGIKASANNTSPQTELAEESLKLDIMGEDEITVDPSIQSITLNVSKNSKIENEKIKIKLPEGVSFKDQLDNVQLNEDKNEIAVTIDEENSSEQVELKVDSEKLVSKTTALQATLTSGDNKITSNEVNIKASNNNDGLEKDKIANADSVIKNGNDDEATKTEKETENKEEESTPTNKSNSKTKTTKADNGNGMTTLEGVPNAPKPETHMYADPEKTNEVDVSTWAELDKAMKDKNISKIFIQSDLNSKGAGDATVTTRSLSIYGNGYTADFKATRYLMNSTVTSGNDYILELNNWTIYGTDYYGPFNATGAMQNNASGALLYNDVTYVGAQLTASYTWDIEFKGTVENHSVASYISPDDGTSNRSDDNGQENIEAKQIIYHDDSHYVGSSPRTRILALTGTGGIQVGDNAYIELTSGSSLLGTYYAVNLEGALILGDNSEFIINDNGRPGAALQLTTANTSITAGKNSKLTINEPNDTGSTYTVNMAGQDSSIQLKEGAEMTINAPNLQSSYPVLYMGNRTSFIVEDSAKLNINASNKTYTGALIQVYGNAQFIVKDNGEFNVHETNKGNRTGNIINVGNNSSFIIGKKATFDISSDGSGNHNLIDLGTNSTFQFADAEKVNMQFTNDNLNANSRLIAMLGSAGTLDVDVQDVKAWNRTDISNNDTREADYHWTPMFGMITQYNSGTATVKQAESVMNSVRDDYAANFKTQNYSRLLYSYIEDVEVGITNEPNDNVELDDSSVIHGVANPGAYVRLTGDDALPEATIPSVVDGSDNPELTDDYTVIADESGKFTVHAKEGEHFTASNTIKAYAFLGGKMDEDTFKVLDKTAPTAEGKTLTMADGTDFPTAKKFITKEADTNPANEGYDYKFKEDYSHLANEAGTHQVIILLTDDAGNTRNIPATIEVVADAFVIEAEDFKVNVSDLKKYNTTEKLNKYLLEESKANAYGIIDFEKQDLTDDLTVKSTSSIENFKKGKYDITLELISEGKTFNKTFTVTVLNDEAVAPTNPEKPGIEEKPEEQENTGTGQTGLLKLDYAPSTFDFGTLEFGFNTTTKNAIKTTSDKQWLQVSDDRGENELSNWSIQVSQNHELENANGEKLKGATITVPKGNIYTEDEAGKSNLEATKVNITSSPTTVFNANVTNNTKGISTNVWQATDVELEIPGNQDFEETEYSNEINWSLVSEVEDDE